MSRRTTMRSLCSTVAVSLGVGVLGAIFAAEANAGCADFQPSKKAVSWQTPASFFGGLSFVRASDDGGWWQRDDIVGMWRFTMTIPGPNGPVVIDDGYSQWHEDGTEIMNSGAHAPNTSNFCLGVWKKINNHYKLNHAAISWDSTGTVQVGAANIVENVELGPKGNAFSGTFTITQYDMNGNVLEAVSGNITGQRVDVNTVINTF